MNTEGQNATDLIETEVTVSETLETVEVPVVAEPPVEAPAAPAVAVNVDDSALYIHRELSQLQFNIRVLEQALDESYPLLERLKFLLIFSSNLDEFFEIRVAGLKKQITFAREQAGADGLLPHQALARISEQVHEQVGRQYAILNDILLPELAKHGVRFIRRRYWTPKIKAWVRRFFRDEIAPIITPIGLDPTHPFPLLVNKSLNFVVELEGMDAFGRDSGLAIIPAPRSLPRIIRLPEDVAGEGDNYVFLSSMIHAHADDLFSGMKVKGCYQFRLTRNADLSVDAEDVEDLARALRGELFSRRYGDAVRLEVVDTCPAHLSNYLLKQFGLAESELYKVSGPVNLTRLFSVTGLASHPELQYPPFTPTIPKLLQKKENMFGVLAKLDVLLMHPFESFTPVVDLLRQAAKDPNVLAIKQTLYRSGANSEIVDALVEAARNGKEVTAVIELRARFDEESNLQLASRLQQAGAVVIYGVVGFKTHAKMMLILRREDGELRRYAHLGTGNYHAGNARLYTDYSLLTADVALCEDLHKLFNQLIGMGKTLRMKKLLHAPFTLKKNLLEMINREAAQAAEGKPAHIMAKVNSLTDPKVIRALYKASQAGVKIDLVVRGMCCLRPGVPGVSHNIQVRSIIGRFLEHSRIYYFLNGGDEKLYLSSADWMERNLDMRVETCFPVEGKKLVQRVKKELELYLADNTQAWVLQADGSYQRLNPTGNQNPRNAQAMLLERLCTPVINGR
ncbi:MULTISPECIES: polyphosphate kinase 1 [Pseudomonas]|jgi:polyphosphate kinase|uniref:Polyphosphate kinase n=1 Tax=Pseudomonas citronellolis TaxID=53408 RepID=A0A127ML04_9PSED|nr:MULTISPECIES: polyphosphate kinase 1 [Pseudomonas]KSW24695.1 polyphosphate kinase [Pseudomonas sp. ADP]AMO73949.1 Polyphosphate kinase [Pseudomonas citronellolis]ANI12835.1 RNA degradosome polyphosphate kinase [Pseudomonas citronellolis]KRV81422.1 polyphosphate kinase [Pseudomonas citronellolis]KRW76060.1 polyphosphate kinase [Pseudomonas citronellolis]